MDGVSTMRLSVLLLLVAACTGFDYDVIVPGDVILGGLFSVQTYGSARCNQVNPESVQIYQAVRWFLQRLNDRNYINNVRLGIHAYDICNEPEYGVQATLDMLEQYKNNTLYGLLGPGRTAEVQPVSRFLSSLPEEDRIPQLSYSATAAVLSDKSIYRNLLRVIVSDKLQVEVLHQLVVTLEWNYLAIVYEEDTYGIEGASALRSLLESSDICVPVYFGIAVDASAEQRRVSFNTLADLLQRESESPVLGLVFVGRGSRASTMFDYLNIELETFQVIASEAVGVNTDYLQDNVGKVYPRAKGTLTISPPVYESEDFKTYWQSMHTDKALLLQEINDNNWLLKYMEHITECSLENATDVSSACMMKASTSEDFEMSFYTSYALTAVAAFAKTIKELYKSHCPIQDGVCDQLRNYKKSDIIQAIADIRVDPLTDFPELLNFNRSFGFKDGEIDFTIAGNNTPSYNVFNYQQCASSFCLQKVGEHVKGGLAMNKWNVKSYKLSGVERSGPAEAQCQPSFSCLLCEPTGSQGKVYHVPGDFYVIGLAPMHGHGEGPLECGDLRTSFSVDIAEAIAYAVQRINQKRDQFISTLGDKTVGLILIDTCNNPLVARERVLKLERGELQLDSNLNSSSIKDRIIGYVGPYGSSVSVTVSSIMKELDKVFISYASTSTSLSSRSIHPTFMRTCSPDHKQANVIMYIANELKAKYVQIIFSDEEYGRAGMTSLVNSAQNYKICIAQTIAVPDSSDSSIFRKYVSELRRFPHAKVVVIFVRSHLSAMLVKTLSGDLNSDEFIFIGGESWGKRSTVIEGNDNTLGSLSLAQELPKNQGFEDYFDENELSATQNPWLQEYLEKKSGCYFAMSFNKISNRKCTPSLLAQHQDSDPWVPFAINAVYSLVLGFSRSLAAQCPGSLSICPEYKTSDLITNINEVRLDIYNDGGNVRVFDDNGEGNVGYTISQVVRDAGNLAYAKVGDSTENTVRFTISGLMSASKFESECQTDKECQLCKVQLNETARTDSSVDNTMSVVIGLSVVVAVLLIVIIVLVILGIRRLRNKTPQTPKTCPQSLQEYAHHSSASDPNGDYLTTVHKPYDTVGNVQQGGSSGSRGPLPSPSASQSTDPYLFAQDNQGIRLENDSAMFTTGT